MKKIKPEALAGALGEAAADKRLLILRAVGQAGSISQAARDAGISYKAAWQALDTLSNLAGAALVERAVGGAGGGGARLTAAGRQVLAAADAWARTRAAALARPHAAVPGLALRTSMRNQLPCVVDRVLSAAGAAEVTLRLPGGDALRSRITRESAQLLGLSQGMPVLALFKATAVDVAAGGPGEPAACRVTGRVERAAPARTGGEVTLELKGGQRVVGFAPAGHGLRRGQDAVAAVAPSAVVIALPD
jgi:molybdate transport system regulatory protein